MADKMLIDASHEEETRVVVVRGNRIEEFDFESQHKKQIRGNIYLAKVTRVEPSLQAAFVDYGGNRHGFLAFAEIHPDYYQIPAADRQALMQQEEEDQRRIAEAEAADPNGYSNGDSSNGDNANDSDVGDPAGKDQPHVDFPLVAFDAGEEDAAEPVEAPENEAAAPAGEAQAPAPAVVAEETAEAEAAAAVEEAPKPKPKRSRARKKPVAAEATAEASDAAAADPAAETAPQGEDEGKGGGTIGADVDADTISEDVDFRQQDDNDDDDDHAEKEVIESVGAEDALEEVPDRVQRRPRKQYRIQEVIKRRQILLVQVAKEERGNKGAALTTYLSLAGRYSVLMPNTARGGGISRKITNATDRKRLKEIARELEVPQAMGVILRTAGASRTRAEIKRDFEYLMRLWENVRTLTLGSTAPCLVYEEGSLIKRSIRDLYNKDISEIIVSGEEGYREAKDFMKMLMPSHAKVVQPYRDIHPIFSRSGIEAQLDRMLQQQVTLKSGGYLIINQTEALVAIDVNSGRSTREHSIEETALATNLEAAEEVARQLRLRDLAGLIVIDFIDMEEKRNNRSVEKRLKDCLKNDRARIQVGRISHFGLLEMSRQRIRASVLESTTQICPHCGGTGHVRSQSSVALHVLRGIEEYLLKHTTHDITVKAVPEIALYLLNQKRGTITDYEKRFGVTIVIDASSNLGSSHFAIERGEAVENPVRVENLAPAVTILPEDDDDVVIFEDDEDEVVEPSASTETAAAGDENGARKRKRRRRRRNRNGDAQGAAGNGSENGADDNDDDQAGEDDDRDDGEAAGDEIRATQAESAEDDDAPRKRRRRGKRGGRRRNGEDGAEISADGNSDGDGDGHGEDGVDEAPASGEAADETEAAAPEQAVAAAEGDAETAAALPVEEEAKPARPRRSRRGKAAAKPDDVKPDEIVAQGSVTQDDAAANTVSEAALTDAVAAEPAQTPVEAAPQAAAEAPAAEAALQPQDDAATPADEEAHADDAARDRGNRGEHVSSSSEAVVKSSQPAGEEQPAKPKKAGWWQKRGFF